MRPEVKFWQQVRPYLSGHVTRIENAAGNGMPDVHVMDLGVEVWIELKIAKDNGTVTVRKEQRVWMMYHRMNKGRCYVLAKHGSTYYVFDKPDETEYYDDRHQRIISEPKVHQHLLTALSYILTPTYTP